MRPAYNKGNLGHGVVVKHKAKFKIGKGSTYNDNCWFNAKYGISIGENTLLGPNVTIITTNHVIKPFSVEQNANDKNSWCKGKREKRIIGESVKIGHDVWIGANVTILAGSNIPNKCVIGSGCVITKSNSKQLKPGDVVVPDVNLRVLKNRREI